MSLLPKPGELYVFLRDLMDDRFFVHLTLRRAPQFLRFVHTSDQPPDKGWDALDQLDDTPREDESIRVGVRVGCNQLHIDATESGRRVSKWVTAWDYELVRPQPAEEETRDTAKWQAWCVAQAADLKSKASVAT